MDAPAAEALTHPPVRSGAEPVVLALLALATLAVLWWRWVGYQGHDDSTYAMSALAWVRDFPPLGTNHWSLRYTLVLPIAAVIALAGPSIWALTVVNVATYAGFLVVGYLAARHWFGWRAAALLTGIGILLPQFPVQATYANPDLPEMALALASFWALMLARDRGTAPGTLEARGAGCWAAACSPASPSSPARRRFRFSCSTACSSWSAPACPAGNT